MNKSQIKIALLGMDERSKRLIKITLVQNSAHLCEVVDLPMAEMVLVDMDSKSYREELQQCRKTNATMPVIAMSIKPLDSTDMYFLRKPLSIPSLMTLMQQISSAKTLQKAAGDGISTQLKPDQKPAQQKPEQQKTSKVADILARRSKSKKHNENTYAEAENIFFDPSQYTIAYVLKAIEKSHKSNKQIVVQLWGDKTILVDAQHGKILTDVSSSQMRPFGVAAVNSSNTKVKIKTADPKLEFDFSPRFNNSIRVATIDEFVWNLAYITARGRIPKTLDDNNPFDLQSPVYIDQWPNFTRMDSIPHAIQIVAYWIQQPTTLSNLTKQLQVNEEFINGLFFACKCIGIAGQGSRQADGLLNGNVTAKHKNRSLFAAILVHLRGKK